MTITVTENTVVPGTVSPGGTAVWTTRAQASPTTEVVNTHRDVRTPSGETVSIDNVLTINAPAEAIIYDPPTCDDPRVTLAVDPADPTRVTLRVS